MLNLSNSSSNYRSGSPHCCRCSSDLLASRKQFDEAFDFSNVALFPWTLDSLNTLWDGEYADRNTQEWTRWGTVVADLYGAIAAVGNHRLYVKTHTLKHSVDLPEQTVLTWFSYT